MTLSQLQTFATVARLGSLTAAARELQVSVPAVSAALAVLRRELGDELVVRAGAGIALTAGGVRLAAAAAEILGVADEARRQVREAHEGTTQLRIAATHEIAEYVIGPLVEAFTRARPAVLVTTATASADLLVDLLRDRRADAALGPAVPGSGFDSVPFLRPRATLVAAPAHPLAGAGPKQLAALATEPWLVGPGAQDPTTAIGELVAQGGVDPERMLAFPSWAAAIAAIESARGIGPALAHAVQADIRRGALVELEVLDGPETALWHATFLSPDRRLPIASELRRFVTSPAATQAIVRRSGGATAAHFRPAVYVTIWS